MRVKVCGLTLVRDLRLAEAAGAEYVGIIVEANSPRALGAQAASLLARAAKAKPVYVTVDLEEDRLVALAELRAPAAVQLHGVETPDQIEGLRQRLPGGIELWKAVSLPVGAGPKEIQTALALAAGAAQAGAARVVLDTRVGGRSSGSTSVRLALDVAREFVSGCPVPCALAGGLSPDDLQETWDWVGPWALDLSSRLERSPGVKDPARMRRLAEVLTSGGRPEAERRPESEQSGAHDAGDG